MQDLLSIKDFEQIDFWTDFVQDMVSIKDFTSLRDWLSKQLRAGSGKYKRLYLRDRLSDWLCAESSKYTRIYGSKRYDWLSYWLSV